MSFINLQELEAMAQAILPPEVFDYYAGGANDEISLHTNREAFDTISLNYRILVDVSRRSAETTLFGQRLVAPIVVAPMAFQRMAHPEGEEAVARGTGAAGLIMTASTFATCCLEDIATSAPGPLWFQLYTHKDRGVTKALVERAEAAGYRALVLTADVPELGRRERDERNAFIMPPGIRMLNFPDMYMAGEPTASLGTFVQGMRDSSLNWNDFEELCAFSKIPVIVKGLVRADDAARAIQHGAQGIVVSNHGGRQLDTAIAPIRALPAVVEAVDGRIPILVDGGIRRGTDVLKAIALGASAVMLGRPVLWGLTLGGEAGVQRVLEVLIAELDLAMALCGAPTLADIKPDLIAN